MDPKIEGVIEANRHTAYDLAQMQSLPLEVKILMTQERIRQWYEHWEGQVYVSFSGGKDSTVLKHIVDSMYDDVPALFVNTGLEYPEIQKFVKQIKAGEFDCFNSDVEIIRPEMRFDEVIKKYGYPVVSKEVALAAHYAKTALRRGNVEHYKLRQLRGEIKQKDGTPGKFNKTKWEFLLDAPFDCSDHCCAVMKKKPAKTYEKSTRRAPIIGTLASDSLTRKTAWMRHGCNAFESDRPSSQPLSFWSEQDILNYLKTYNVPYCSVYGDIVETDTGTKTTGCSRTGCIFCMFGCHLEKEPNRFQRLKQTHSRQYDYCINGGEMVDGKWQPSKDGLGLGKVLDYIGVPYGDYYGDQLEGQISIEEVLNHEPEDR